MHSCKSAHPNASTDVLMLFYVMLFPPCFCPLRHSTASKQATQVGGKIEQDMLAVVFGEEGRGRAVAVKEQWWGRAGNGCGFRDFEVFWLNEMLFYLPPPFPQHFLLQCGVRVAMGYCMWRAHRVLSKVYCTGKRQVSRKTDKWTDILFADFVFSFCSSQFCDALNTISFE